YANAKARIFENQTAEDFAVLNADDPTCVELSKRTKAKVFWFSRKKPVEQGAYVDDPDILFQYGIGCSPVMRVSDISLNGALNLENVLAAVCVGRLIGCPSDDIANAVRKFKAVEHRLEYVATIN